MSDHPITQRLLDLPPGWRERIVFASAAGSLSFAELGESMRLFASWLGQVAGVGPGDRVAVCLPKGLEAVQIVYGVLHAGATYAPLPFHSPAARLRAILSSLRPRLLLTTAAVARRLAGEAEATSLPPIREIEPEACGRGLAPLLQGIRPSPVASISPDDLAAIYFTSGSTAEPKGVMLSHRNIATSIGAMQRRDRLAENDRRISHAGMHYVASFDLFLPTVSGCRVFLLTEREAMFPEHIVEVMARARPTVWTSSTTALRLLLDQGGLARHDLPELRRVAFYGEPMPPAVLRRLMDALPYTEFLNHYGATEVYNMAYYLVPRPLPDLAALPIGRPVDHCVLTLRDQSGAEVKAGEVGEICVTGPAVTSGYWHDPELTAAKRLEGRPDSYRTGDLAVLGEDGLLRLVGRSDHVVKLRGHRFGLAEIEAALKAHDHARDAVAIAVPRSQGDAEIRAAVSSEAGAGIEPGLRRLCHERLPAFAQPARITILRRFPLLSTGKVDRQTLQRLLATD